jgi:hypothetical protein
MMEAASVVYLTNIDKDGFHDLFDYPHFEVLNIPNRLYFGFYSSNPYTLW